jgi:hypothetical protein
MSFRAWLTNVLVTFERSFERPGTDLRGHEVQFPVLGNRVCAAFVRSGSPEPISARVLSNVLLHQTRHCTQRLQDHLSERLPPLVAAGN